MMPPDDHWPCCYSADETEAGVRAKAAVKLGVPETEVEVEHTDGCWLARVRQEETE